MNFKTILTLLLIQTVFCQTNEDEESDEQYSFKAQGDYYLTVFIISIVIFFLLICILLCCVVRCCCKNKRELESIVVQNTTDEIC